MDIAFVQDIAHAFPVGISGHCLLGFGADEWRADNLIGFVAKFTIGMGLAFQMPMVILSLVKIGFVDDRGTGRFGQISRPALFFGSLPHCVSL